MPSRRQLFVAALAAVLAAGCSTQQPTPTPTTYVLVHGAFQDQRAWDPVVPLLTARGIRPVTVDLPGRAHDGTSLKTATLDAYRDAVLAVVRAQPGPVVLVGHSFGGLTISAVAEAAPEKVRTLVFVAAYLPEAGAPDQSLAKMSAQDAGTRFNKARQNFIVAPDYQSASVLADDQVMLFCNDCSPAAQQQTLALLQREPLAPAATPVVVTAARFGQVDKVYVHTTRDNALSYGHQQKMVARTPVRKTLAIDSGHSPFLSQPQALADALVAAGQ